MNPQLSPDMVPPRTPGSWRWNPEIHEVQDSEGDYCIAVVMAKSRYYNGALLTPDDDEAEANGRLLAGAPHLLRLVKELRHLAQICDAAAATGHEEEFLEAGGTYWMSLADTTIKEIEGMAEAQS